MKKKASFRMSGLVFLAVLITIHLSDTTNSMAQIIQKKNLVIEEIVSQVSQDQMKGMLEKLVSFETRNTFSDTTSDTRGVGAARRWIYRKFMEFKDDGGSRLHVYYDGFDRQLTGRQAERAGMTSVHLVNVVAVLPGRTDNLRFIVNGHYDSMPKSSYDGESIAYGANDDGSGTVITMELARILSKYEFEHTLIFSANIAEEQGLWGARHMLETAQNENWEIGGVIANDIVGNIWGQNSQINNSAVRVFSKGPDPNNDDSKSRNFARYIRYIAGAYVPLLEARLVFRLDRFGRGGDHSPFHEAGFAGVRFTEMNEYFERQHDIATDSIEYVSIDYIAKVAQIQASVLSSAGMAPRPVNVIYQRRRRSDMTTELRWIHETKENDVAGYKIFIRSTDQGYWQEIMDIGMPEKMTNQRIGEYYQYNVKGRSVDDYIFGIAPYDTDGNEGIVATYERPQRRR